MRIDHDQIFKKLIEAFFREFLELFCPDEARLIDFAHVEFLGQEHFTDVHRGRKRRLDMVVKVALKQGGAKCVLIHTEFQASRNGRDFPRRMYRYYCQLFLRHDMEIVPIAMFTDNARWRIPVRDYFELRVAGRTFVRFEYHLIKLKHLDYRQFLGSNNPLAFGLMAKMDYNRRERVRLKADFLRWILAFPIDEARRNLLVEFVETYVPLAGPEQYEFEQIVVSDQQYSEVKQMITVYEKRGIEEGMEKGMEKGKQEDLILLLEKKFGKLSAARERKIRKIESTRELESLLLAVLDAKRIEDLPL